METILFYLMGAGAVAAAVGVVAARSPVASVLCLLGSFFCLAVVYLLAGFQFLAAAQLLVYAGAIMVLFLFVIMLLNIGGPAREALVDREVLQARHLPLVLAVAASLLLVGLLAVLSGAGLPPHDPRLFAIGIDTITGLAVLMFGRYLLAFEAASILLLAAAVAVLVLAKRQRREATREVVPPTAPPYTAPSSAAPRQRGERPEPALHGEEVAR